MKNVLFKFIISAAFIIMPSWAVADEMAERFIQAPSAVSISEDGTVIYSKRPLEKLPPASTTKLLTAMVVLDRLSPDAMVTVSENAARTRTVRPRVRKGEEISVRGMLELSLMRSINSAAVALAEATAGSEADFVGLMNEKAESIGAINSKFANASGLPEAGVVQYTTTYDLAVIMREALHYPMIKEILGQKDALVMTSKGRAMRVRNSNMLLWMSDDVLGGKTGFTNEARHCFAGAKSTSSGTVYTAVLGARSRWRMWQTAMILMELKTPEQLIAEFKANAHKRPAKRALIRQRMEKERLLALAKKNNKKKSPAKSSAPSRRLHNKKSASRPDKA